MYATPILGFFTNQFILSIILEQFSSEKGSNALYLCTSLVWYMGKRKKANVIKTWEILFPGPQIQDWLICKAYFDSQNVVKLIENILVCEMSLLEHKWVTCPRLGASELCWASKYFLPSFSLSWFMWKTNQTNLHVLG